MILDNSLWLYDEPTGSLDMENKKQIMELFRKLKERNPKRCIIIVTHDLMFREIADILLFIRDGTLELEKKDFDQDENLKRYLEIENEIRISYRDKKIYQNMEDIKKHLDNT